MKKGTSNMHQFPPVDVLAKAKPDTQISLNHYLERLKESVSKKRKLKTLKQKRDTLLFQVKFLRRRRYLLKHPSLNSRSPNVDRSLEGKRKDAAAYEAAVGKNSILRH